MQHCQQGVLSGLPHLGTTLIDAVMQDSRVLSCVVYRGVSVV